MIDSLKGTYVKYTYVIFSPLKCGEYNWECNSFGNKVSLPSSGKWLKKFG
jgi:hypothetical protein